ncbi:hypothetical protein [Pseudalkalibacillus sp. SCS-8]|uniref:hypothetical protein n=1 Tax=Pseudalkalibacillus nanhaiensis TaxID=3115291 RepID=UPI0032DA22CC
MGNKNSLFQHTYESKDPLFAPGGWLQDVTTRTTDRKTHPMTQTKKKLLTDDANNKWYYYPIDKNDRYDLIAVNDKTGIIMKKRIHGTPNIYEFEEHIIIACEGDGEEGFVYQFSKQHLEILNEWEIDGFIWDVNEFNGAVCVSAYVVDLDIARLYILNGKSIDFEELGTHFAPADLLVIQNKLYISAYPLTENSPKKILMLDERFVVDREYEVSICPRFLYENGKDILIQELDVKTGRSDRYVSLNLQNGKEVITQRKKPVRSVNF